VISKTKKNPVLWYVTGGKGGVGKSTVTVNLAVELSRRGRRVLLCDLDLGLANVDVMLRVPTSHTLVDAITGRCELADCVSTGPCGLHLVAGGSGEPGWGDADRSRREQILEGLRALGADYDVILCDGAAGIGGDVLGLAVAADRVLLVTTPDASALTDAYGLLKALDAYALDEDLEVPTPDLVVNLAASREDAQAASHKLRRVSERFLCRSPRRVGWIPDSSDVRHAASIQSAFVESSAEGLAARCVGEVASLLDANTPNIAVGTA
jgi:flagellar biosynthesis protein FlhG